MSTYYGFDFRFGNYQDSIALFIATPARFSAFLTARILLFLIFRRYNIIFPFFAFSQSFVIIFDRNFFPCLLFKIFSSISSYFTTTSGNTFIFIQSAGIIISCNLSCRSFSKHCKDKFQISHMISQIFIWLIKLFEFLIL